MPANASYSCENIMKNEGRETQNNIFISDLKDLLRSMRVMTSTVEVLQTNFSDDALKTCRHITGHWRMNNLHEKHPAVERFIQFWFDLLKLFSR